MTWNTAVPAGSDNINLGDNVIREFKTDVETALTEEGVFPGADTANPVYKWTGKRGNTAARPASPSTGELYFNTQLEQLEYYDGASWTGYKLVPTNGIVTANITDANVTADKLATDAVTTVKITDANVTRAKLAAGAVGTVNYTTKTGSYTATTDDDVILCSGAAFTITLYAASGKTGRILTIKKTDSSLTNIITIDGNGTETIDGSLTTTLNTINETVVLVCDGTNWQILDRKTETGWVDGGAITITATTTNPNKASSPDVDKVVWRRVGNSAEIIWRYKQSNTTGASSGSGTYLFALPSSLSVDTTLFPTSTATTESDLYATLVGYSGIGSDADTEYVGAMCLYDSTKVSMRSYTGFSFGSGHFALASFNQLGFSLSIVVPISGWNQ